MLLFRTDANAAIGMGHVTRSLALAEAWVQGGGRATFAMREPPADVARRLDALGIALARVSSAEDESAIARATRAGVVVVDGYEIDETHQRALAAHGAKIVVVDDNAEIASPVADVIVNGNPYATPALYAHLGGRPELLLGAEYTMLREAFRRAHQRTPARPGAERILVSFGGSDPANLTPRAIDALRGTSFDVRVVVGGANPRAADLRTQAGARVRVDVAVGDMTEPMSWADIAVVAAGGTSWELACLGVPAIAVVVADNQRRVGETLKRAGLAVVIDSATDATPERLREEVDRLGGDLEARTRMARSGPALIDGKGVLRICDVLRRLGGEA